MRCMFLHTTNTWPYAKRCENEALEGSEYCEEHKECENESS
jgi:hypothetical protein